MSNSPAFLENLPEIQTRLHKQNAETQTNCPPKLKKKKSQKPITKNLHKPRMLITPLEVEKTSK